VVIYIRNVVGRLSRSQARLKRPAYKADMDDSISIEMALQPHKSELTFRLWRIGC